MENYSKNFYNLGLSDNLFKILNKLKYKNPFPIQEMCIPHILNGFDVLAIANTGSGKTAAFVLPILDKININIKFPQVLILEPTRELAIQVGKVILSFTKYINSINSIIIYGGQRYSIQLNILKSIQHIIISTPGRLIDHIEKKTINLSKISKLVIDEADEMFKMGFINDIRKIVSNIQSNRQTLLFSATMPFFLKKIAYTFIKKNFKEVICLKEYVNKSNIKQYYYITNDFKYKKDILIKFLSFTKFDSMIIFTNTKSKTLEICNFLRKMNYKSFYLNGDMKQSHREKTIKLFKTRRLSILVATDIASRGLDINRINWIINFDFPINEDIYIHRIGRTGRAGNSGNSFSILNFKEFKSLKMSKNKNINLIPVKFPNSDMLDKLKLDNLINKIKFYVKNNKINLAKYENNIKILTKEFNDNKEKLLSILIHIIYEKNIFI